MVRNHNNELPEGFKMTELGPLPEEWEVKRLGDVACFETGKRMKGGALESGEVLSLGGEHIGDFGNFDMSNPKYISRGFFEDLKKGRLGAGDVVICKDGAKTGKLAYIKNVHTKYMAVNEHVFIIRSKSSQILFNQFMFFFMFSDFGQDQVREAYHGLIGGITNNDISSFQISLPPLPEQKAIAGVLSTIQKAVETQDKIITAMRELKKSLMRHLFTYGPVPPSEAERVPLKEAEIGLVPEHWEVKQLADIATLQRGKDLPKQNQVPGQYPVIGSSGVMGYHNEYVCVGPGVVTGRSGSIGKLSYVEEKYWPHNTGLYVKDLHGNNPKFIYYLLHLLDFKKYATGVSVPTLNRNFIHSALLPLPSLSEQREIADIMTMVDKKIETEDKRKAALQTLFKTMLHLLMTGKVRVKS